jgi:phenylacetate-CoA ligase
MSVDERTALQTGRLRQAIEGFLERGGPVADRLRGAGVTSGREVTLADLPRLPTTTKQDLWDAYPWGMLAVPREQVVAVHGSSGTRGRPTLVGYTQRDYHLWGDMTARSLGCAGAGPGSIVHNAYGYGLFTGGMGIHLGAVRMGATVVPMSGGMTQRQVTMLADLQPDVLTCTPSYAVTLGEAVRAAGVELTGLRAGVFGAEPWTDELRATIESLLPLKALDIYGLSEVIGPGVATECIEAQSGLHVNEDHFLVEALDPLTQEPVADGVPGELVFTTPTREALPLLRYRTGDIASLDHEACVCGRTLVRMSKVLGRRDDMIVVRGVNVYPSEVEAVLLADERVAPHYLIVVDRHESVPRLIVCCEASPELSVAAADDLTRALRDRLGLTADVRVLAPGTIPRQEVGKAIRVRTWQEGTPPIPELDDRAG